MMNKTVKIILKSLNYIVIISVIVLFFLMSGIGLFGIKIYAVLSGSMEPDYKVGSLIYVKNVDPSDLKEKDVITFKTEKGIVVTHRINEISYDENSEKIFRTKGDANDEADDVPIYEKNIIGKPIFTISYLGYLSTMISGKKGKILLIGFGALLIVFTSIIDYLVSDEKGVNDET